MSDLPAHSALGASGAHRWFECPASVGHMALAEGRGNSRFAAEGTMAHELASSWLEAGEPPDGDWDMLEHVDTYVRFVTKLVRDHPGATLRVEERFRLHEIEGEIPMFGTADAVVHQPRQRHLHIVDFKYGVGLPVSAYQNPQLLYYALGVWYEMRRKGVDRLTLTIVQPRAYHPDGPIRSWTIPLAALKVFEIELMLAVQRVADEPDSYEPGEHCRFCPAASRCRAFRAYALGRFTMTENPHLFTDDEIAEVLRNLPRMKAFVRAMEEERQALIDSNRLPPNMKLVPGKKVRIWREPTLAAERLEDLLPEGFPPYASRLISPAQVESIIGRDRMEEFNDLIDYAQGKPQLADISDPREAVGSPIDYAMKGL